MRPVHVLPVEDEDSFVRTVLIRNRVFKVYSWVLGHEQKLWKKHSHKSQETHTHHKKNHTRNMLKSREKKQVNYRTTLCKSQKITHMHRCQQYRFRA